MGMHKLNLTASEVDEFQYIEHIPIAESVIHPEYHKSKEKYDIWMIRLEWGSQLYADHVVDLDNPTDGFDLDDGNEHTLTVMGFGKNESGSDGIILNELQEVDVEYIPNDVCVSDYDYAAKDITFDMLCAGNGTSGGEDACNVSLWYLSLCV